MTKLLLAGIGALGLSLAACDCDTHYGVVGVAYQAVTDNDYNAYLGTIDDEVVPTYGSVGTFQGIQQEVKEVGKLKEGPTQVIQQSPVQSIQQTLILGTPIGFMSENSLDESAGQRPVFRVQTICRATSHHKKECRILKIESLLHR